jgi:CBS domain containing-hemolysin-like protein
LKGCCPSCKHRSLLLLAVLLCVAANGFFVAAEFALAKVRPTSLQALAATGDTKAQAALKAIQHLDGFLAATQLGITLASLGLGWLGEPAVAVLLEPLFRALGASERTSHTVSLGVAFGAISVMHIVLGELVPKSLAIQFPEQVSRNTASLMAFFFRLFAPALWLLNGFSNWLLRAAGVSPAEHGKERLSLDELRIVLKSSFADSSLDRRKRETLERVLGGFDLPVRAIMVPRVDMISLALSASYEANLELARQHGFSRYPVSDHGGADEITGYLYVKDLFVAPSPGSEDLRGRIRKILFVPETYLVGDLLSEFQKEGVPIAIVVDEFGGTAGLVTLEDAVEAVVGEITDELDKEAPRITAQADGSMVTDGAVLIHDLRVWGLDTGNADADDTLGGHITAQLGRPPHPGDLARVGAFDARVDEVRRRRVRRVVLLPRNPSIKAPPSAQEDQ